MILPFKGDYKLGQGFANKFYRNGVDVYAQYGLQGHNGLDHDVPCYTPLYAMISGKVIEVADEGNIGYGKYVKIENDKEGALVAHLSSFSSIKVGDQVIEGETLIGKSGTSGNSTGCHTHTGYYRFPRNRQNGFAGYIDPIPYITKGGGSVTDYKGYDLDNKDSMKVAVDVLVRVQKGEFVDKPKYEALEREAVELRKRPVSCPPAGDPKLAEKLNKIKELATNSELVKINDILKS